MKKNFVSILALLLALVMLVGCQSPAQPVEEAPAEEVTETAPAEETAAPAEEEAPVEEAAPAVESDPSVQVDSEFRFAELATTVNGDNGLTFYYTENGTDLIPFTDYQEADGKWFFGPRGLLVYPCLNLADNYGAVGTSQKQYVVMGYKIPATGTINLFSWIALQGESGEHGYHVKVALGTLDNVIENYDCIGDTQTVAYNNYFFKVEAGQELFVIYEPEVWKDGEWCGYQTCVKYMAMGDDEYINPDAPTEVLEAAPMDIEVKAGDSFYFTEMSTTQNGENGLTYYHTSDGVELVPFNTRSDEEDKWWYAGQGCLVYPRMDLAANYGVAGSSATDYVAMGFMVPASGTIDLNSWTAIQGPSGDHGYVVKIALNEASNVIAQYDCIGDTQTIAEKSFEFDVQLGDEIILIYEPTVWKDGEWYGYETKLTYTAVS